MFVIQLFPGFNPTLLSCKAQETGKGLRPLASIRTAERAGRSAVNISRKGGQWSVSSEGGLTSVGAASAVTPPPAGHLC